ncbi:proprotein convertase subtilisin/kexin type 7-like [Sycon ciliatum]|uniref:proprotein convertase subtilisin/kexin type 7-like n=1 Tax=Sycon ciliatum TaxID=27933 RepID=UPI0031F718ED
MSPDGQRAHSRFALLVLTVVLVATADNTAFAAKWAAQVREDDGERSAEVVAQDVARDLGFLFHGSVGALHDTYVFSDHDEQGNGGKDVSAMARKRRYDSAAPPAAHEKEETSSTAHPALRAHKDVVWHSEQRPLVRIKRGFNDPLFPEQWYLVNTDRPAYDHNVTGVWEQNITGAGVVVSIVDDGLEMDHPDLASSYNPMGSTDLNANDNDPSPRYDRKDTNHHGTRCAGEIVGQPNNSVCGIGIAYGAQVSAIRILDGDVSDSMEAAAFGFQPHINHIYSCSWGPDDDGKTVDGPRPLAKRALKHGIDNGRYGLGSLFVVASGNGGRHHDNCNFDGYANSIYTITIGGVGEDNEDPAYNELCAATMAVAYSSDGHKTGMRAIATTDLHHSCTTGHTGTSAAAPLAAGLLALILEVRPCLTWRDVQYLLMLTATKIDSTVGWTKNGAGLHHSYEHGFGLLTAWRMVQSAKTWRLVPPMESWVSPRILLPFGGRFRPARGKKVRSVFAVPELDFISTLEHVVVQIHVSIRRRGALQVILTSPRGTASVLATPRIHDHKTHGLHNWNFSTVRCWGEDPQGNWTLTVQDTDDVNRHGLLHNWRLTLYGTPETTEDVESRKRLIETSCGGDGPDSNDALECPLLLGNYTVPKVELDNSDDNPARVYAIVFLVFIIVLLASVKFILLTICVPPLVRWWRDRRRVQGVSTATFMSLHSGSAVKRSSTDARGIYSILQGTHDDLEPGGDFSLHRTGT